MYVFPLKILGVTSIRSGKEKPFPAQKSEEISFFSHGICEAISTGGCSFPILSPKGTGQPKTQDRLAQGAGPVPSGMPASRGFSVKHVPSGAPVFLGFHDRWFGGTLPVKLG